MLFIFQQVPVSKHQLSVLILHLNVQKVIHWY